MTTTTRLSPDQGTLGQRLDDVDGSAEFGDDDYDDEPEFECERCRGFGMDPECDRLLPCPLCQGEQRP